MKIIFPDDFIWGVATASYQIEGAWDIDGKGESIWDRFSHTPGNVLNNDTGDNACDFYNRYEDDIKLIKELGVDSYRFSISWPRIFPDGKGKINQKGIDFYKRVIELLNENGIKPSVTLYHWDLPQKLQDVGGWTNYDITEHFQNYAYHIFKEFGDSVKFWITHNEPAVSAFNGYLWGNHAPGIKDVKASLVAARNMLVSHGKAVKVFREMSNKGEIGITLNMDYHYPESESEEDRKAVQFANLSNVHYFMDPLFHGIRPKYLQEVLQGYYDDQLFSDEQLKEIYQPIDFLGLNNYTSGIVRYDENELFKFKRIHSRREKTEMDWEIWPEGIYDLLMKICREYTDIKILITENGAAFDDRVDDSKSVNDARRVKYIKGYLGNVKRAIDDGVNVKGYYVWSLMDNFEWAYGYSKRFGIVYIDYNTQERILKNSGKWYRDVIKNKGF